MFVPPMPLEMFDRLGATITVTTPEEYVAALWDGYKIVAPPPIPPRDVIPAFLADLDDLEAQILAEGGGSGNSFTPPTGGIDGQALAKLGAGWQWISAATATDIIAAKNRANHTGTQTSLTISDFQERVEDLVAGLLAAGTNVSVTYDDTLGKLTLTSTAGTGGGTTDPEIVRDTIGVALAGTGVISVVVNDAGDTITISSTATANDTNANLRARSTHTGTQPADTITDTETMVMFTVVERTKLAGIADGATANATNAQLRDRSTHTGVQAQDTITGLVQALSDILTAQGKRVAAAIYGTGTVPLRNTITTDPNVMVLWSGTTVPQDGNGYALPVDLHVSTL